MAAVAGRAGTAGPGLELCAVSVAAAWKIISWQGCRRPRRRGLVATAVREEATVEEHCVWMTTRQIKPGTLADFGRAWRPDTHPDGMLRASRTGPPMNGRSSGSCSGPRRNCARRGARWGRRAVPDQGIPQPTPRSGIKGSVKQ